MNRNLSKHDRINAVLAGHKVEEFRARQVYLHSMGMSRHHWGTFWLRSDNSTFGHGFGRMMGFKQIYPLFFGDEPPALLRSYGDTPDEVKKIIEKDIPYPRPKLEPRTDRPTNPVDIFGGAINLWGHNDHGVFSQGIHAVASPVIEVADDGKSARSFYLTPGTMTRAAGPQGGRHGGYLWERYGSEFVFRDGRWWWFHEQVCPDISGSLDVGNWAQDRFRQYLAGTLETSNITGAPRISDLREAHTMTHIVQTVQDTVPLPEPYEKLDEENTYSPGCSDFSGYIYPSTYSFGDYLY